MSAFKFSYKNYGPHIYRPVIPIELEYNKNLIRYEVLVDSGADGCIFDSQIGEVLGIDVESGESREIITFRPTEQFLNILPYFDQYHQSATIWSPDNNNLVISFVDADNNPGIAIIPTSGTLEPRLLAPGYIAFWSWE